MALKMKPLGASYHPVRQLGEELFGMVQASQGRGFVSDGISEIEHRAEFFRIVRNHLRYNETASRLIRKFLKKYGEI